MMKNPILTRSLPAALVAMLAAFPLTADVLPVDLPAPDDKPAAKDKPVKIFILSGQSNALGFGRIEGATPLYSNVFLSADPSVKPCKMPVDDSALLPLEVFPSAKGGTSGQAMASIDSAEAKAIPFGGTAAQLPEFTKGSKLHVKTHIQVPYDGNYEIHVGTGGSSHCVATIGGVEVYRKNPGQEAAISKVSLTSGRRHLLEIEYFEGGSAALWLEQVDLEGKGDLRWVVEKLGRFPCMIDDKGEWTVRNDVMLNDAYMGKGKSAPLGAPACGPTFGPELGFGYVLGSYLDEPVIVMKADIGNRSLGWDILPPGSESYTFDGKQYPGYKEMLDTEGKVVKFDGEGWYAGKQYDDYTAAIHNVLDNFGERYPEYEDQGFEVAGFFWWQGHKDGPNPAHNARYEQNLVNLIKAWRKEFNAPEAKWTIATVGFEGENMSEEYVKIAQAQLNVADPKLHPELTGTVKTIDTRPFWRGPEVSPKNQNYHYNHNAETYMLTGDALGRAMVELLGGKVEYPPARLEKEISAVPFMSPPAHEEVATMSGALRPIMVDKLIPEYVGSSEGVPGYRRYGMPLANVISNTGPEEKPKSLKSQLDKIIGYYNVAGIHDYDWRPFGPEMQKAGWHYLSFDPKEPVGKDAKGKLGDMYREVTLPAGNENWASSDFDPAKAGWKTGTAPFGQKDGELAPLISGCKVSHCGCDIPPATLWDKEVILIRQSFQVPDFEEDHRYRIVVGGAGHAWSGEGFALYLNGKLISEVTGGYYKGGGDARGAYIFEDLKPEFENGKATFAVKAFLRQTGHRGKAAPPSGHLSVWIEEARLPAPALKMTASE